MILCIFGGGKEPSPTGCAEGLAPCLIGEFSALPAMRLGKFPNKLRYFLRKYPAVCRRSARVLSARRLNPLCVLGCLRSLCRLYRLYRTPSYYFSLSVDGGRRGGRFRFQRLLCSGRSDARFRGRIYPKHEGGDCSPNGVAARPCSRRKAPCLLRLCKRE